MFSLLNRFDFHTSRWSNGIALCVFVVWITVLGCIISSILAQPFERRQRLFWIAMVILLPGIGVLSYLPFTFRKDELPPIFHRKSKHSRQPKHDVLDPDA